MTKLTRREFIKTTGGFVSAAVLSSELAHLAEAQGNPPFNILFLMTDQHNHAVMGCSGNPVAKTPTLDKLASDGVRFTNALCATPFCSPTRASLLNGLWPHTHGITKNVRPGDKGLKDDSVLTEQILFDRNYETYQMGKWHLGSTSDLRCFRKGHEKLSRDAYREYAKGLPRDKWHEPREGEVKVGQVCCTPEMAAFHNIWKDEKHRSKQDLSVIGRQLRPPEYSFESWLADRCIELIKKHRDDRFMITWSVSPPHGEWTCPDPYYSMYDPQKMPYPPSANDYPEEYKNSQPARMGKLMGESLLREYLRCYYGQVTMMDWCMGRILDALAKEELERDTLVLYTSDHGDMQAAHAMIGKSLPAFYEEVLRVPLIMRYPRSIKPGTVVDTHANSVDVAPTLLDFAGVEVPKDVQGVSLKPLIEGKAPEDDRPGFCEREHGPFPRRMIRTKRWKYAVISDKFRELFDLQNDPCEMNNLADSESHRAVRDELHKKLWSHMQETKDHAVDVLPKT